MTDLIAAVAILGGWGLCVYGTHCVYPPAALIGAGASLVVVGFGTVKLGKKARK